MPRMTMEVGAEMKPDDCIVQDEKDKLEILGAVRYFK